MGFLLRGMGAAGLAVLLGASLASLAAPWVPPLELVNHFRPHWIAGGLVLIVYFYVIKSRRMGFAAAALVGINLLLAVPAFVLTAPAGSSANGKQLTVVSFNMWGRNQRLDKVEDMLRRTNADVVFLQEVSFANAFVMTRLRDLYPYSADCIDRRRCRLAILSKSALSEVAKEFDARSGPPTLLATTTVEGQRLRLVNTHLEWPFDPYLQRRDLSDLTAILGAQGASGVVLAGDFNLTPWSWGLSRLAYDTGLRRLLTLGASWPANRFTPQVLIDQIFVSPDLAAVDARTGPAAGSDHLPVVARIALGGEG